MRLLVRYIMAMDTWNPALLNPDDDSEGVNASQESFARGIKASGTVTLREEDAKVAQDNTNGGRRSNKCAC